MSNDAAGDGLADVLAGLREQLADIAAMQKKQAVLRLSAAVAEGTVEVTVDARGQLVKAVVDKSYLDDHGFEELGGYVSEAARAAAGDAGRRVAEMLAPINERHRLLPSFSDLVEGVPDLRDLLPSGLDGLAAARRGGDGLSGWSAGGGFDGGEEGAGFPTVRR